MDNSIDYYDAVAAANKRFIEEFAKGDAAGLSAQCTEDCLFLPPNTDFVKGRAAIQTAYQSFFDMGIELLNLETVEAEGHGDKIVEVGKYTLMDGKGHTVDHGKYIVVWKNVGGQWMVHRDIINSSVPLT